MPSDIFYDRLFFSLIMIFCIVGCVILHVVNKRTKDGSSMQFLFVQLLAAAFFLFAFYEFMLSFTVT